MKGTINKVKLPALLVAIIGVLSACNTQNEEPTPIPDDVPMITEIPAKYYKDKLAPTLLPNSLKHIGDSAFFNCKNEFIVIPEGVETIGKSAFAKRACVKDGDMIYFSELIGKLEWLYLPSTLKTIGESACVGALCEETLMSTTHPTSYFYEFKPNIVMTSPEPPKGFVTAYCNSSMDVFTRWKTYVPEKYLEKYKEIRYLAAGEFLKQSGKYQLEEGEDFFERYPNTIANFAGSAIPFYSYKPIDIEITKGEGSSLEFDYNTTPKNEGEITEAEWDTSDHSIAEISSEGILTLKGEGITYVQCVVYTKASNGDKVKFYFFKPIKVTSKEQNGYKNLVLN